MAENEVDDVAANNTEFTEACAKVIPTGDNVGRLLGDLYDDANRDAVQAIAIDGGMLAPVRKAAYIVLAKIDADVADE